MSGDVEMKPGPIKHHQSRILYANTRRLHGNLNDVVVVFIKNYILFSSETLVFGLRHHSGLLINGFKNLFSSREMQSLELRYWLLILEIIILLPIRPHLNVDVMGF